MILRFAAGVASFQGHAIGGHQLSPAHPVHFNGARMVRIVGLQEREEMERVREDGLHDFRGWPLT